MLKLTRALLFAGALAGCYASAHADEERPAPYDRGVYFHTYDKNIPITVKVTDRDTGEEIKTCELPCHIETGKNFKRNNTFSSPGRLSAGLPLTLEKDQLYLMEIDVRLPTKQDISGEDADVHLLYRWAPFMPAKAKRSGHCHVTYDVNAGGAPINIKAKTCTERTFKKASIESVELWRYYPMIIDGKPKGKKGITGKVVFHLMVQDGDKLKSYPCTHESHDED